MPWITFDMVYWSAFLNKTLHFWRSNADTQYFCLLRQFAALLVSPGWKISVNIEMLIRPILNRMLICFTQDNPIVCLCRLLVPTLVTMLVGGVSHSGLIYTNIEETSTNRAGVAEPGLKIWDKNLGEKFGTDKRTDRRTDRRRTDRQDQI